MADCSTITTIIVLPDDNVMARPPGNVRGMSTRAVELDTDSADSLVDKIGPEFGDLSSLYFFSPAIQLAA